MHILFKAPAMTFVSVCVVALGTTGCSSSSQRAVVPSASTTPSSPEPPAALQVVTCYRYANTTGLCKGCGVACDDGTNYPMSCSADMFSDISPCQGRAQTQNLAQIDVPRVLKGNFGDDDVPRPTRGSRGSFTRFDSLGVRCPDAGRAGAGAPAFFTMFLPERNATDSVAVPPGRGGRE